MRNIKKSVAFTFLILSLLAIIPLASGLSTLQLRPGQQFVINPDAAADDTETTEEELAPTATPLSPAIRNTLLALLIIMIPVSIIVIIRSPELFKEVLKRDLRIFLLFLAGFFIIRQLQMQGFFNRTAAPLEGTAISVPDLIRSPTVLMGFGLGFLLLGLAAFSFYRLWQRLGPLFSVSQIAQDTIQEIQAGTTDLRDVIIRCYFEMCRALQGSGRWERDKATTPRELAHRLASAGVAGEEVERLTRLFEKVRYGAEILGKAEEQEAVTCLQAIVTAIDARRNRQRDPLPPLGFKRVRADARRS